MCGIVGVLSPVPVASDVVVRMRDTLTHRGPDHAGLWHGADERVWLGHRRLAVIDLDARANQPMRSSDGRLVAVFNGEIYNFRTVRERLEADGCRFRTDSDTEVLLEAYRRWGRDALDRLSGQFAFAIWDAHEQRLWCARDRAGEKPFYYAALNNTFLFASELKALVAWPGMGRRVDYEALVDFLAFGFVAEPKSILREVRKLPPAHEMTVEFGPDGAVAHAPARYWKLTFAPRPRAVTSEEIRATLLDAANEMAIADVPLGTFLSGGVDSSTVTAALSLSGRDVRSFTIGFEDESYDERGWARQVAERYRTDHVERTVVPTDMLGVVDRLGWHYDEPFADYSSVPTYYLCREARQSITVALSGDGADELFAGYRKYQRLARRAEMSRLFPVGVARAVAAASRHVLGEGSHWRRTLRQYGLEAPAMLADMLSIGLPLPLLRQVARGPLAETLRHYDSHRLIEQMLTEAPPDEVGVINAMRHLDFALTLPADMLVKVDRASMAVSLEVRPLFLHRAVMEMAAGIAPDALASRDSAKMALKTAVRPWLPDPLIDRRKQGFAMPLPQWLADNSAVGATMRSHSSAALADLIDLDRVRALSSADAAGAASFTALVYSAFVLDRWLTTWTPT